MKWVSLAFSVVIGMACGWLIGHILGPDSQTRFDESYQSRLDRAQAEGRQAAKDRQAALWQEFDRKRQPRSVAS